MKRIRSETLVRVDENYFFYICLTLVIAIAAFGIVNDVIGGS